MTVRIAFATAILLGLGCARAHEGAAKRRGNEERFEGSLSPAPHPSSEVVALVNGDRIYLEDVERQARERKVTPSRALRELIDAMLLSQEAARRGLANTEEAASARKRERVRRLIEDEFESRFNGPEDVPQGEIDKLWTRLDIQNFFNHELYHEVAYARVPLNRNATPEKEAEARKIADEIHKRAIEQAPKTWQEFHDLAGKVGNSSGTQVDRFTYSTTRHHSGTFESFAAAVFSISKTGDVAKPVRTPWGWDVIYLYQIIPKRQTAKSEAEPEIRQKIFDSSRRAAFQAWVDGLVGKAAIVRSDERLTKIEVQSPVGLP
ncbi:MAG: peptidylprolyl isomerase [Deltaproteobacteria bacterium]|nr:peptidylprolyl isomerase [Deltaproteobacteria bacterium]